MLKLLVQNSYVKLGEAVFKQTCGIPMGINPEVFMANYFLFFYECAFIAQLAAIIAAHPPSAADHAYAQQFFAQDLGDPTVAPAWLTAPPPADAPLGALAYYVLHCFRHTGRFVDDFTSGPNPLLHYLWYDTQSILGGAIKGIYPGPAVLTLEKVPGDPRAYPTLDVRVVSTAQPEGHMRSTTVLYDKRREACYADVPIVQYIHVSSAVSASVGPNVLWGQLHRFSRIILDRSNFVQEAAHCMRTLMSRGFHQRSLDKVLRRFL